MEDDLTNAKLTRTRFAQVPIKLLEMCVEQRMKHALIVYLWLWHYAGRDDEAWPSIHRLSLECKTNLEDTRNSLKWLCSTGWIQRKDRPGFTSVYHVRMENPYASRRTPTPLGVYPSRRRTPLRPKGEGTPTPQGTPNKKTRTRRQEQVDPPTSPPAGLEGKPAAVAAPSTPGPTATKFRAKADDIPAGLLPVEHELLSFWAEKAGTSSLRAWRVLLTELEKIQHAPGGGTEVVREQLIQATQAGWRSVTCTNWLAYGQKRQQPQQRTMTRTSQAVENVAAFLRAAEHQTISLETNESFF